MTKKSRFVTILNIALCEINIFLHFLLSRKVVLLFFKFANMKYIQVNFTCIPNTEIVADILAAQLSEIGFESFVPSEKGLDAFVPEAFFAQDAVDEIVRNFMIDAQIDYSFKSIEDKNWNEEWEKHYFQPIVIDDKCIIHSTFHNVVGEYGYRILIDPKMAFGTGHHQTTGLILKEILASELSGKSVLDMGCGTAVLAILASMKGANPIVAIDIDEWAYQNALENVRLNGINNIRVQEGGAELLGSEKFDVLYANINRNILLQDLPAYVRVMNSGATIVMSGFYTEDIAAIRQKSEECGLQFIRFAEMDNWAAVVCRK